MSHQTGLVTCLSTGGWYSHPHSYRYREPRRPLRHVSVKNVQKCTRLINLWHHYYSLDVAVPGENIGGLEGVDAVLVFECSEVVGQAEGLHINESWASFELAAIQHRKSCHLHRGWCKTVKSHPSKIRFDRILAEFTLNRITFFSSQFLRVLRLTISTRRSDRLPFLH